MRSLRSKLEEEYHDALDDEAFPAGKFIMVYDFLLWIFNNSNKALVASYLIDLESYHIMDPNFTGGFMCTTSYLANRIPLSENTIIKILSELEHDDYIKIKVYKGFRYIKLNHDSFESAKNNFGKYMVLKTEKKDLFDDSW